MNQQKTGKFLKYLRKGKGLTQEQLAGHFYVSPRTISRWENGNNMPDVDILIGLADFYEIDIRELIDGERKESFKIMILTNAEISNITTRYYSRFCCTDLSKLEHGIYFVCSAERDNLLKGYGCKYALYILRKADLCVVAYSPVLEDFVNTLKHSDPDGILAAVEGKYRLKRMRLLVFQEEKVTEYGNAKVLEGKDYPLFESFFRETHKNADPDGWLPEYFSEKEGCLTGYFKDGRLVSVCDAPDMPYMQDKIQHTGIVTLEEER